MKICIADPQERVRFGLRVLLRQQPGWVVAGEACDSRELLALARADPPDVVLVDCDLPDGPSGDVLRTLRMLRSRYPSLVLIAMSGRQELGPSALKAGADGFTCKMEPPERLLEQIRELVARRLCRCTG